MHEQQHYSSRSLDGVAFNERGAAEKARHFAEQGSLIAHMLARYKPDIRATGAIYLRNEPDWHILRRVRGESVAIMRINGFAGTVSLYNDGDEVRERGESVGVAATHVLWITIPARRQDTMAIQAGFPPDERIAYLFDAQGRYGKLQSVQQPDGYNPGVRPTPMNGDDFLVVRLSYDIIRSRLMQLPGIAI